MIDGGVEGGRRGGQGGRGCRAPRLRELPGNGGGRRGRGSTSGAVGATLIHLNLEILEQLVKRLARVGLTENLVPAGDLGLLLKLHHLFPLPLPLRLQLCYLGLVSILS